MTTTKKKVTSLDVARAAGVSQSVVSRSFTPGGKVAKKTREKVLTVARELGYQPNIMARNLVKRETNIVGIIMADITNPFYPYVLQKFTERFQQLGREVLLLNVMGTQTLKDALLRALQYQVEAIIVTSATLPEDIVREYSEYDIPIILFNRYVRNSDTLAVSCDNVEGGRLIANVLLNAGHKSIAYIGGRPNTSTNEDRLKGFRDRLQERGYRLEHVVSKEYGYEWGFAAARSLFSQRVVPDAIFCANDIIALGALDALRYDLNLSVPETVSVIGFDDIPAASWPAYALTTIRQPVDHMIDVTLTLFQQSLNAPGSLGQGGINLIPGQFTPRQTAKLAPSQNELD